MPLCIHRWQRDLARLLWKQCCLENHFFLSDKTSLPEIAGEAAFYFSSFEAADMQYVFKEGMQRFARHNMSALVIQRGQLFDWEQSAAKYLKVYQSLL